MAETDSVELSQDSLAVREALAHMRAQASAAPTYTTVSGIVLGLSAVPSAAVQRGLQRIKEPAIPRVDIGDGIMEDNPADPDYLTEMDAWSLSRIQTAFNIYLGLGTRVISVPDNMHKPESDKWSRKLSSVGVDVATDPDLRFMDWIRFYAVTDATEIMQIAAKIMALSGTLESDVLQAVNWFRRSTARHSNTDNPPVNNV